MPWIAGRRRRPPTGGRLRTSQGGLGYPADQWYQGVGTFLNYGDVIDNVDGNQAAFLFSVPGLGIYQDLAATYQVGQSYDLAVAFEGGGYGMAVGVPVSILLSIVAVVVAVSTATR